ncbi:MAG: NUDIX domain-containing protein [Actinomycetes bacterium]
MSTRGSVHADAVQTLRSYRPEDSRQRDLRDSVLAHLLEHDDGTERGCRPDHVTASAIVLSPDGRRVMLDLHRKVGLWLQFGGHIEPEDPGIARAALREAREESGVDALALWSPHPLQIDVHPAPCGARHHLDVQFLACCDPATSPRVSAESHDVRWFDVDRLPSPTDVAVESLVARAAGVLRQSARDASAAGSPTFSSQAAETPSR